MLRKTIIAAALCLSGSSAFALPPPTSGCYSEPNGDLEFEAREIDSSGITCSLPEGGSRSENQAFVGIVLTLNRGEVQPKVSAGLRRILVEGNDHVTGVEINFTTAPSDLGNTTLRLVGLAGKRNVMANIGLGYNVADNSLLINGGVQMPYLRASVDYNPKSNALTPQLELNSYGKIAPAAAVCDGSVLSPSQILQKLIDSKILRNDDRPMIYISGDIYNGQFMDGSRTLTIAEPRNDAVYNSADETCLATPIGADADLD